jgi:hypothetical protein
MSKNNSDSYADGTEQKVEWYNRECRGGECDEKMADMSRRVYCNDCFDARSDHAGRGPDDTEKAEEVLREALGDRSLHPETERGESL